MSRSQFGPERFWGMQGLNLIPTTFDIDALREAQDDIEAGQAEVYVNPEVIASLQVGEPRGQRVATILQRLLDIR